MSATQHEIPDLDRQGLRRFGLVTGAIVAVLFGAFFPWVLERAVPLWPFVLGGVLAAWALVAPASLGPVYRAWMRFGALMSRVTTPIVMGVVFYVVIAPIGFVMRLTGWDAMRRRFDPSLRSYREASQKPPREHLERPS